MQGAQWRGVGERDRIRENERTGTHAHAYEGCAAVSWFVSIHVQIFKKKANAEKREIAMSLDYREACNPKVDTGQIQSLESPIITQKSAASHHH